MKASARVKSRLLIGLALGCVGRVGDAQEFDDFRIESLNLQNQVSDYHALVLHYSGSEDTLALLQLTNMVCRMSPEPPLPPPDEPKRRELAEKIRELKIGREPHPRPILGGDTIFAPTLRSRSSALLRVTPVGRPVGNCTIEYQTCVRGPIGRDTCKKTNVELQPRSVSSDSAPSLGLLNSVFSYRIVDNDVGEVLLFVQELANHGNQSFTLLFPERDRAIGKDCKLVAVELPRLKEDGQFDGLMVLDPKTYMLRVQAFKIQSAGSMQCALLTKGIQYDLNGERPARVSKPNIELRGTAELMGSLVLASEAFGNVEYDYGPN